MREIPHSPVGLYEIAHLFGALIAETILAGVHVRARKYARHMGASDLINAAAKHLARRGPSTYGEFGFNRAMLENRLSRLSLRASSSSRAARSTKLSRARAAARNTRKDACPGLA